MILDQFDGYKSTIERQSPANGPQNKQKIDDHFCAHPMHLPSIFIIEDLYNNTTITTSECDKKNLHLKMNSHIMIRHWFRSQVVRQ